MKRQWLLILGLWLSSLVFATDHPQSMGELPGRFVINKEGGKVCFSQGNLRCNISAGTKTWSFAPHQYDILGTNNDFNTCIDLFGWSGKTKQTFGVSSNAGAADYAGDFLDWGQNAITNGGNTMLLWRTLTAAEWEYLYNNHDKKQLRINDVGGVILLPDNCTLTLADIADKYTAEAWTAIEAKGVLFIPYAGTRSGTTVNIKEEEGCYWSSDKATSTMNATAVELHPLVKLSVSTTRSKGYAVRLVKDVEDCQVKITVNKNIQEAGTITFDVK
jgi:hypothetical protein